MLVEDMLCIQKIPGSITLGAWKERPRRTSRSAVYQNIYRVRWSGPLQLYLQVRTNDLGYSEIQPMRQVESSGREIVTPDIVELLFPSSWTADGANQKGWELEFNHT